MFERSALAELKEWATRANRKPQILRLFNTDMEIRDLLTAIYGGKIL